jgi:hypothetical protein
MLRRASVLASGASTTASDMALELAQVGEAAFAAFGAGIGAYIANRANRATIRKLVREVWRPSVLELRARIEAIEVKGLGWKPRRWAAEPGEPTREGDDGHAD